MKSQAPTRSGQRGYTGFLESRLRTLLRADLVNRVTVMASILLAFTVFIVTQRMELRNHDFGDNQIQATTIAAERLFATLQGAETGQRGYLLTGKAEYLDPYNAALGSFSEDLAELSAASLLADPAWINHIERIRLLAEAKVAELQRTVALRRGGDLPAAIEVVQSDEGKHAMDELQGEVAALRADADGELLQERQRERGYGRASVSIAAGLTVLVCLLLAGLYAAKRRVQQEREARLLEIAETIPGLVFVTAATGENVYTNQRFQSFTGLTGEALLGKSWTKVLHPEDMSRAVRIWKSSVQTEKAYEAEYRLRGADGAWHWFLVRSVPLRGTDGFVERWYGICTDITDIVASRELVTCHRNILEQRVAERTLALAESEHSLRMLVESVVDYALYRLDAEGHVKSWNIGAKRIKGYQADDIISHHFSCFYTEEDRAAGKPDRALQTAEHEGRFEDEGWRVRQDGSRFWAHIIIDVIRDDSGVLLGFAKITRDITAQRTAQIELQEAERRLVKAQKMEAVGQLTGGIAHDFNNLMQAVSGNLELARAAARNGNSARIDRLLDSALRAIGHGASLTGQLLAFSRRQILRAERLLVSNLIGEIAELIHRAAGETIEIETQVDAALWHVNIDPIQFESALLNLVINARDAMPCGGVLSIRISNSTIASREAAIIDLEAGDYVRVDVVDTGVGMTPEVLLQAFEPFFTTKEVGKGSGLGLAQVHGFTRQSKGCTTVDSAPGQGTTIAMYFPRDVSQADEELAPASPQALLDDRPEMTVLLVEDEPSVLETMQLALVDAGHHVVSARDGPEALAVLRSNTPIDIMVSDVVLPHGLSGFDLGREARQLRSDIPVLLATGYSDVLREQVHHGEFEILAKPFRQTELLQRMAKVMGR